MKAWIVTALQYIDTDNSRERELDIAVTRPIWANRKRKIITREICRQRDNKRFKNLHFQLQNLNLNRFLILLVYYRDGPGLGNRE